MEHLLWLRNYLWKTDYAWWKCWRIKLNPEVLCCWKVALNRIVIIPMLRIFRFVRYQLFLFPPTFFLRQFFMLLHDLRQFSLNFCCFFFSWSYFFWSIKTFLFVWHCNFLFTLICFVAKLKFLFFFCRNRIFFGLLVFMKVIVLVR